MTVPQALEAGLAARQAQTHMLAEAAGEVVGRMMSKTQKPPIKEW